MSRPLMWVGVAYTLGVIWAAGDQKLFYGTAGIVLFVWITGRIRQPWKEKRLFWLLPVFFVSGFVIFDHAMTRCQRCIYGKSVHTYKGNDLPK